MTILLTKEPISITALQHDLIISPQCGAAVWFEGIVRSHNQGQLVEALEYSSYATMAKKELQQIINVITKRWSIDGVVIAHRIGRLKVGEASLIIGLTSAHRKNALLALDHLIDELKQRVPIWKKEFYTNAKSEWI